VGWEGVAERELCCGVVRLFGFVFHSINNETQPARLFSYIAGGCAVVCAHTDPTACHQCYSVRSHLGHCIVSAYVVWVTTHISFRFRRYNARVLPLRSEDPTAVKMTMLFINPEDGHTIEFWSILTRMRHIVLNCSSRLCT
jgi:hypothetical protein